MSVQISILAYYASILAFIILVTMFLFSILKLLYWLWKNKYDKTNTQYEAKHIKKHRKYTLVSGGLILLIALRALFFYSPVDYKRVTGYGGSAEGFEKMHVGYFNYHENEGKTIEDKKELQEIINILSKYEYRKSIRGSRFGSSRTIPRGTKSITFDSIIKDFPGVGWFEVQDRGIIHEITTGQGYTVADGKGEKLFRELYDKIFDDK